MDTQDQQLILGLADRLRQAQPARKDPQIADLINRHVAAQPDAIYLLAQAVLVQEDALRAAQAKIAEQNERLAAMTAAPAPAQPQTGGGFLSGMFGRNSGAAAPAPQNPPMPQSPPSGGGSSFLKTAAAAAAGVAGGGLLLQGLNSAFGGHEPESHAASAEPGWDDGEEEQW